MNYALAALRHHATGAIERGEAASVAAVETRWTTFGDLPIGKEFWLEGHYCRKKSSRTAWMYFSYGHASWFYLSPSEQVTADLLA